MSIRPGDRVRLEYVGRFESGAVFATSQRSVAVEHGLETEGREFGPLSFVVGNQEVIEGLDSAVRGLTAGDEATVTVPPEEAYGEYDPERVREYDPESFERMVGQAPAVGLHVEAENGLHGDVTAVSETAVEVDFNHELAGRSLVFEFSVLEAE
ncbi:peptidylprolyl isomerase [Halovenus sp. WSH3]|uniref:Peptidyl-prolyl cis-trans isomerase n=1 Tax=Halovenus carboxidivorans TaxID=2692199 RepID=A0A6B0SY13_9EURY|nr:peptidylprolyl isomerase [Halovenus carboxidivorans]